MFIYTRDPVTVLRTANPLSVTRFAHEIVAPNHRKKVVDALNSNTFGKNRLIHRTNQFRNLAKSTTLIKLWWSLKYVVIRHRRRQGPAPHPR